MQIELLLLDLRLESKKKQKKKLLKKDPQLQYCLKNIDGAINSR